MNKVAKKILQGSVASQTVFGGLTIHPPVANVLLCTFAKNYENWLEVDKVIATISRLTFWPTLCMCLLKVYVLWINRVNRCDYSFCICVQLAQKTVDSVRWTRWAAPSSAMTTSAMTDTELKSRTKLALVCYALRFVFPNSVLCRIFQWTGFIPPSTFPVFEAQGRLGSASSLSLTVCRT